MGDTRIVQMRGRYHTKLTRQNPYSQTTILTMTFTCLFFAEVSLITPAEHEVMDSRLSEMSQSCFFGDKIGALKVCRFSVLFGYLTK